jgi:hypothetical protein
MTEIIGLRVQRHHVQGSGPLRRGASLAPRTENPHLRLQGSLAEVLLDLGTHRNCLLSRVRIKIFPIRPSLCSLLGSLSDTHRFSKQMASPKPKKFSRPETDYERWLRGQDERYEPGDQPIYGPPVERVNDPIDNGKGKLPSNSRPSGVTSYSILCSIILSVIFTIIIIQSAKVLRKRRRRGGEFHFLGQPGTNEE